MNYMYSDDLSGMAGMMGEAGPESYAFLIFLGIVLFTVLLFIFSHFSRYIIFLKLKERTYVDDRTLDSVSTAVRFMGIIYVLITILFAGAQFDIPIFLDLMELVVDYLFIMMAGVTFFSFLLIAQLSSVWFSIKAKEAKEDPDAMVKSGILDFAHGFVKYILLFFGIIIAFLVGVITTPNQQVRDQIFDVISITDLTPTQFLQEVLSLITILVVLYLVGKLITMMLDDFKSKSTKFPGKFIDLIKSLLRYLLYWLAFVVTMMVLLEILGFEYLELVVYTIVAITITIMTIVGISPSMKSAISGIVLLLTDSINKGDWVKIGDDAMGEVIEQHLVFTRVRTNFGDVMDIPNDKVMDSTIHNFTTIDGLRLDIEIPVDSSIPIQQVERIIKESCAGMEGLDPKYDVEVRLLSISKDHALYCINTWVLDPSQGERTRSDLLKKFHERLKQQNISLGSSN